MDQHTTVVGFDVHRDSITVAVLPPEATRPREMVTIENQPKALQRLVTRVGRLGPAVFVYEAGPCGYEVQRQLTALACRAGNPEPRWAARITPEIGGKRAH